MGVLLLVNERRAGDFNNNKLLLAACPTTDILRSQAVRTVFLWNRIDSESSPSPTGRRLLRRAQRERPKPG